MLEMAKLRVRKRECDGERERERKGDRKIRLFFDDARIPSPPPSPPPPVCPASSACKSKESLMKMEA